MDATIIAAPSSTKNSTGKRDPQMHQAKKGNQWYFGMKAHIGADADSGLVHSVIGTAANVGDVTQADALLRRSGRRGVRRCRLHRRREPARGQAGVVWRVAMKAGKRRTLGTSVLSRILERLEQLKASVRSRVEHPFRVIKRQVRLHQGALPRPGQEHRPTAHAVCSSQHLDGASQAAADRIAASRRRPGRRNSQRPSRSQGRQRRLKV